MVKQRLGCLQTAAHSDVARSSGLSGDGHQMTAASSQDWEVTSEKNCSSACRVRMFNGGGCVGSRRRFL